MSSEYESQGYRSWINIVSAVFKPISSSVYIAGEMISNNRKYYVWNIIKQKSDAFNDGKIRLPVFVTPTNDTSKYNLNYYKGTEFFVESYDNQFYNYYNSRYDGNSGNDIFGTSGSNVKWNIKGEELYIFRT